VSSFHKVKENTIWRSVKKVITKILKSITAVNLVSFVATLLFVWSAQGGLRGIYLNEIFSYFSFFKTPKNIRGDFSNNLSSPKH